MNADNKLQHLIYLGQEKETAPVWALTLKLQEEVGEFSEAALQWYNFLKHKPKRGTLMEEGADIVIVTLAALAKAHPDMTPDDLLDQFMQTVESKTKKYEKILNEENRVAHSGSLDFDDKDAYE